MPNITFNFSPALVSAIKSAEGCRLVAYRDSVGLWTIGYGHLLDQSKDWTGYTITQAQAEALLEADMRTASLGVSSLPEARGIDPVRFEALLELVFNLGSKRWSLFTHCRAAIADRDWQRAHDELLNSKWAGQVGTVRSNRIASLLLTGCYV